MIPDRGRSPRVCEIRIADYPLSVEIADTDRLRNQGLMFRRDIPDGHGMLFLFPESKVQSFWMKDTPSPLSIAFIREDGTISNIADMVPHDMSNTSSSCAVPYVLEVRQGWFDDMGIREGDRVVGIDGARHTGSISFNNLISESNNYSRGLEAKRMSQRRTTEIIRRIIKEELHTLADKLESEEEGMISENRWSRIAGLNFLREAAGSDTVTISAYLRSHGLDEGDDYVFEIPVDPASDYPAINAETAEIAYHIEEVLSPQGPYGDNDKNPFKGSLMMVSSKPGTLEVTWTD